MNMAFFAVAMTVLIGFAGLATDSGLVWVTRTELQHSVDAAALAGAQELDDADAAEDVACEYATDLNEVPGMFGADDKPRCGNNKANVEFDDDDTKITVTAYRTVEPIFGKILSFEDVDVHAQGIAVMTRTGTNCLFPFFVTEDDLEQIPSSGDPHYDGPFQFRDKERFLEVGGSSWQDVASVMTNCEDRSGEPSQTGDVGDTVEIKQGTVNSADKAWERWAGPEPEGVDIDNPEAESCDRSDPSRIFNQDGTLKDGITLESCPRLIVVPVIDPDNKGQTGRIERFAIIYFSRIASKNATGYLLDIEPEDLGGAGTGKKVTLVSR